MDKIYQQLIVSCQALENEPLHSSFIMAKMALAAKKGGAAAIRSNGIEDITAIKKEVDLPVIGIIKKVYNDSKVYITPTMQEVDALVNTGVEIIAMDATNRMRPDNIDLETFFKEVKAKYPDQLFMADCSTISEALYADELGFDFIGTTLVGYTEESREFQIESNDFEIIRKILQKVKHPVIAEGHIDDPLRAKRVIELGCYSVVVGSMITRPQLITKKFVEEIQKGRENL